MGEPLLQVDADALRKMAGEIRVESDKIRGLNPTDAINGVVTAMPNSKIGAAAAKLAAPIVAAFTGMSDQLNTLADNSTKSASTYEDADQAFKSQLDKYLAGS